MLPGTEAALPLWTTTERHCSRKAADLASPVDNLMRWPNSFRNSLDVGPMDDSRCLEGNRHREMTWYQVAIQSKFLFFGQGSYSPSIAGGTGNVRGCKSVSADGIPNKEFAILPRHDRDTIGPFPVCSVNA